MVLMLGQTAAAALACEGSCTCWLCGSAAAVASCEGWTYAVAVCRTSLTPHHLWLQVRGVSVFVHGPVHLAA